MIKPLFFAKILISEVLTEGGSAVDATCGNGHDTAFLCSLVGETGRVFAIDIQQEAINNTKQRILEEGLIDRVTLQQGNHADLAEYIESPVDVVMFNLGYLPKSSDRGIITKPDTTVAALRAAIIALKKGGLITLVVYCGHPGGREEYDALKSYTELLPQKEFTVLEYKLINQINDPPLLIAISKL